MIQNLEFYPDSQKLRFDLEGIMFLVSTCPKHYEGSCLAGFTTEVWRPGQNRETHGFRYDVGKRMMMDPLLPEKFGHPEWERYRVNVSNILSVLYDARQIGEQSMKDSGVSLIP